jgi:aspartyl-tRNA(Asn)/glutamyl-tRNA(Gln) amidotransferase subunit A
MDIWLDQSIAEIGAGLREGKLTSLDLTRAALERIEIRDPELHSFIRVTEDRALSEAGAADDAFAQGIDLGPLQGLPYAVKDIIDTAGVPTTCHSKLRLDAIAKADAQVVQRLCRGGAVLLGKLATHEFALGGPSFDLPFPPARNPWNVAHIPGGSSSGSAVAVAAGLVPLTLGSDTLGSIRGPAAYCGIVGLKPTSGFVPLDGIFPLSPSLDHCGPLTWRVEDAAIFLEVLTGADVHDLAQIGFKAADYRSRVQGGLRGLRVGVPRHFFSGEDRASRETLAAFESAAAALRAAGAEVEDIVLPDYHLFNMCGRIIMHAEAYQIHARDLATRPDHFARSTLGSLNMGAFLSARHVESAHALRHRLRAATDEALVHVDAMITLNALAPAPRFDAPPSGSPLDPPMQNLTFNVTGHPALSVPTGLSQGGLPLSAQVVGRGFDEAGVLAVGAIIEAIHPDRRRPTVADFAPATRQA